MKKKIAFFSAFPLEYWWWLEKYFIEIAIELKKRFWDNITEICIINLNDNFYKRFCNILSLSKIIHLTPIYRINTNDIENTLWSYVTWEKLKLSNLGKKLSQFDTIYTKNEILELTILSFIQIKKNIKIVAWVHTPPLYPWKTLKIRFRNYLYSGKIYKFISRKVTVFHTINEENTTFLRAIFKNKEVTKIYNPFNFKKYEALKDINIYSYKKGGKYTIAWSGRLTEQKWIQDLIKIIHGINDKHIDSIEWVIMWDWELKNELIKWISWYSNIKFFWYVKNLYIPNILSQCNLYISTSHWEWFPYNILEAQAMWLPVICYDIAWCNDIIKNWINGFLVKNQIDFMMKIIFLMGKDDDLGNIKTYISEKINYNNIMEDISTLFLK